MVFKLKRTIIKFSTVTYALKAKELIENMGYMAVLRRSMNPSARDGCGYSITVNCDADEILLKLNLYNIKYLSFEMM